MSADFQNRKIDKEFRKIAKEKFLPPGNITELSQTRFCIFELHKLIAQFEKKFNYVPSSARLLFNEYNDLQEKMLYDKFKEEYSDRKIPR